jgi:hypothetical protein
MWHVEAPTFPRQSSHRWSWGFQSYAPTAFYPPSTLPGRFLVAISVRRWVNLRAIVRLELGILEKKKNLMTSSKIESAIFRLVALCFNHLHWRIWEAFQMSWSSPNVIIFPSLPALIILQLIRSRSTNLRFISSTKSHLHHKSQLISNGSCTAGFIHFSRSFVLPVTPFCIIQVQSLPEKSPTYLKQRSDMSARRISIEIGPTFRFNDFTIKIKNADFYRIWGSHIRGDEEFLSSGILRYVIRWKLTDVS